MSNLKTAFGKFVLAAGLLAAIGSVAYTQQTNPGVQQAGAVVANDCVKWGPGVGQIQSAGGACAAGVTPAALTKTDDTNVTLTLTGTPATSLLQAVQVAAGWTGTLSTARGGFGANVSAQSGIALNTAGVFSWLASTGTGNVARDTNPVFTTPNLGTPSVATLTNATGLPIDGGTVNALPLTRLATQAANTVLTNATAGAAVPTAFGMPSCSGAANALQWLTSTGFQCATLAGTGTVTNVATAGLATGGPITTTGTVTVTAATKTDQETATSSTTVVTPLRQQSHPSAVKAWGNFAAATGAVNAGYNMNAATHVAASGTYTINFTTAFASTAYSCVASVESTGVGGTAFFSLINTATKTASSISVSTITFAGGNADPTASLDVACFGTQ